VYLGHVVLCCLSSAGARLVEAVSGRGVGACTSIFPEGMVLRPEECNKLARPSVACIVAGVESLVAEKLSLRYAPLIWYVTFDDLVPAQ
jgi:hypothetical protein